MTGAVTDAVTDAVTGRQSASCAGSLPGVPYFPTMTLALDVLPRRTCSIR